MRQFFVAGIGHLCFLMTTSQEGLGLAIGTNDPFDASNEAHRRDLLNVVYSKMRRSELLDRVELRQLEVVENAFGKIHLPEHLKGDNAENSRKSGRWRPSPKAGPS